MSEKIELYQPSNGTEGSWFHNKFCYKCAKFPHDSDAKNQCQIVLATMAYNVEDPEYPKQWRFVDGKPVCTSFKDREEYNAERRESRKSRLTIIAKDTDTLDLFN